MHGHAYEILYKLGKENSTVDALSQLEKVPFVCFVGPLMG